MPLNVGIESSWVALRKHGLQSSCDQLTVTELNRFRCVTTAATCHFGSVPYEGNFSMDFWSGPKVYRPCEVEYNHID